MDISTPNIRILIGVSVFVVVFVVVIIVIAIYRQRANINVSSPKIIVPTIEIADESPPGTKAPSSYTGFHIDYTACSAPKSQFSKDGSAYSSRNIYTNNHAFLLSQNGMYMDNGNQWGMKETLSISQPISGGRFHLTENGIYFLRDKYCTLVYNSSTSNNKILKLFVYKNALYCRRADNKLYFGFTSNHFSNILDEYEHYEYNDMTFCKEWQWDEVKTIEGHDISSMCIYDVDVGLGQNPDQFSENWVDNKKEDIISISTDNGECHIFKHSYWNTKVIDPYDEDIHGASTVSRYTTIPNRILLGFSDQELHFFGRKVCLNKYKNGKIFTLYSVDNVKYAVSDPKSRNNGMYVVLKSKEIAHYSFEDGTVKKKMLGKRAEFLLRSGNEVWVICTGERYMV